MRTIRVSGLHRLAPDAAESYKRMRAAKLPRGGINSAYRDIGGQRALFLRRYRKSRNRFLDRGPFGDVRKYEGVWYKRVSGYPVSVPGTSKHNSGLAIDTSVGRPVYRWLQANGARHGWRRTRIADDPVHWEYFSRKDKARREAPKPVAARPARAKLVRPGVHVVTAGPLRGRAGPSHDARIVTRKRRGATVVVEKWVRGDGRVWGRTADGVYFAREFLKKKA